MHLRHRGRTIDRSHFGALLIVRGPVRPIYLQCLGRPDCGRHRAHPPAKKAETRIALKSRAPATAEGFLLRQVELRVCSDESCSQTASLSSSNRDRLSLSLAERPEVAHSECPRGCQKRPPALACDEPVERKCSKYSNFFPITKSCAGGITGMKLYKYPYPRSPGTGGPRRRPSRESAAKRLRATPTFSGRSHQCSVTNSRGIRRC